MKGLQKMSYRADILVRSRDGEPIAVVEVKNRQDLNREVAIQLRRNMIAHGLLPHIPYFLLLSQDSGFLWKGKRRERLDAELTCEFSMSEIVTRYLPELGSKERLREAQLELLVLQWLSDLAQRPQEAIEEPERSLELSGFLNSIRGSAVITQAQL